MGHPVHNLQFRHFFFDGTVPIENDIKPNEFSKPRSSLLKLRSLHCIAQRSVTLFRNAIISFFHMAHLRRLSLSEEKKNVLEESILRIPHYHIDTTHSCVKE